tara:strand:- start:85 stop:255 length:171 start_codon:yes stop_codon:yes gene_type:complete
LRFDIEASSTFGTVVRVAIRWARSDITNERPTTAALFFFHSFDHDQNDDDDADDAK